MSDKTFSHAPCPACDAIHASAHRVNCWLYARAVAYGQAVGARYPEAAPAAMHLTALLCDLSDKILSEVRSIPWWHERETHPGHPHAPFPSSLAARVQAMQDVQRGNDSRTPPFMDGR